MVSTDSHPDPNVQSKYINSHLDENLKSSYAHLQTVIEMPDES